MASDQGQRPSEAESVAVLERLCGRVTEAVAAQTDGRLGLGGGGSKLSGNESAEDALPAAISGAVVAASRTAQTLVDRARAQTGPPDVDCRIGCAFCCYQVVIASPAEVLALLDFLNTELDAETLAAVRQRVVATDERTRGLTTRERGPLRTACPLLDPETQTCVAYAVRPMVCQGYNSADRGACEARFEARDPTREVPGMALEVEFYHAARQGLADAAARAGLEQRWLELNAALRIALETPDAATRWRAGEQVFAAAESASAERR